MTKTVRTVRFDKKDIDRIDEFLKENPFFDFSTLTRMAVKRFIENPNIQVKAVSSKRKPNKGMEL